MKGLNALWVVIPVYNEEASIGPVLQEWQEMFTALGLSCQLLVVNDGSTDRTADRLEEAHRQGLNMEVLHQPNRGHGQACITGYRHALLEGAEWVFQMDSDGQCDPRYFGSFVRAAQTFPIVIGHRTVRDDGLARHLISLALSCTLWILYGRWIPDANVPYRLMRRDVLSSVVERVPHDFELANIYLSYLLHRDYDAAIRWVPIRFRKRTGGCPSMNLTGILKKGLYLVRQLQREKSRERTPAR